MARTWTEEDKKAHSELMKSKHKSGEIPSSADSIKPSRKLVNARARVKDLADPASDILHKAVFGGFLKRMQVWVDSEDQKTQLRVDPTAQKEIYTLDDGREIPVLVYYTPATKDDWEQAKWLITQDLQLEKAAAQSKLDKIKIASTKKKAIDEGALPKEDEQLKAKELAEKGEHIKPVVSRSFEYNPEWDEDPVSED